LIKGEIAERVPATALVRLGLPADEIVQTAQEQGVDLIIISTHGHAGLKHVLLGSTAEQVVRRAPCPTLTVREQERDFVPLR
jgi:universal stress protein A